MRLLRVRSGLGSLSGRLANSPLESHYWIWKAHWTVALTVIFCGAGSGGGGAAGFLETKLLAPLETSTISAVVIRG